MTLTLLNPHQTDNKHPLKRYKTAPLPFVGQKRMFITHFEQILTDNIDDDGQGWTIIDVFGGSGLLAHNAKRLLPCATVIYNDFDGYANRLAHIDDINRLRRQLFDILKDEPRSLRLSLSIKACVLDVITRFDGFIDVQTLAKWLLFSGRQVGTLDEFLQESTLYNRINKQDYAQADDYLDGLVVTQLSFEVLLERYKKKHNCLLLLDPPYVCTAQNAYNLHERGGYFGMTKFLTLMHHVKPPYIFFSSTRSELLDYMGYLEQYEPDTWGRIGGFERIAVKTAVNKGAVYEDNMLVKF